MRKLRHRLNTIYYCKKDFEKLYREEYSEWVKR